MAVLPALDESLGYFAIWPTSKIWDHKSQIVHNWAGVVKNHCIVEEIHYTVYT